MKFCPTCETKYDEEILRFCIKDGTPLVDEKKPEFKEIPSETPEDDDIGEQTIIRRNKPSTPLPPTDPTPPPMPPAQPTDSGTERLDPGIVEGENQQTKNKEESESKRIVISTAGVPKEQGIRPKNSRPSEDRHRRPRKSNVALVALLSVIGTLAVLAGAIGIYWFLSSGQTTDANTNQEANLNSNIDENVDTNFNADDLLDNLNIDTNQNANLDINANSNINTSTPTPTPKPSKTPTPTPSPSPTANANVGTNTNVGTGNVNTSVTPTVTRTPTPTPTKTATPVKTPTPSTNSNKPVNVGQINGRAVRLPTPAYSPAARQARASGRVTVRVIVDERGNVVAATATGGHPLLRRSAERAARRSKFRPVSRNGQNVKSTGTIAYNFVN